MTSPHLSPCGGGSSSSEAIENEIRELEEKLAQAKLRRKGGSNDSITFTCTVNGKTAQPPQDAEVEAQQILHEGGQASSTLPTPTHQQQPLLNPTTHFLLLLADSALPLGSFAFSSGLESYLAHAKHPNSLSSLGHANSKPSFDIFLPLSIASYASTTLPFLLTAHRDPSQLAELDDALDAAVICTVGKRASVAQGRALLGIWERSFSPFPSSSSSSSSHVTAALQALTEYTTLLRTPSSARPSFTTTTTSSSSSSSSTIDLPPVSAHLAPLFGVIASLLGLSLQQTAYVFMLGHVKALVSAAVRANLMGPYAAQKVLASVTTQEMIAAAVEREWTTPYEEAGQSVPVMDLWIGRHEMLYSRIFNS